MEEQEEKEIESVIVDYECPKCFLRWSEDSRANVIYNEYIEKMCSYCQSWIGFNRPISEEELLRRRIEVMSTALLYRLPIVIKQLFDNVKFKWDE